MARRILIASWLALNAGVLLLWLRGEPWIPGGEGFVFLGWATLALTFPAGLVVMLVWGSLSLALAEMAPTIALPAVGDTLLLWALMVTAGYLQWFELLPRWIQRLRSGTPG